MGFIVGPVLAARCPCPLPTVRLAVHWVAWLECKENKQQPRNQPHQTFELIGSFFVVTHCPFAL